mmetsp:Transcript_14057/g.26033  ORF Transcript_14057/g.26033 Transcript_14057/m.26033 type:complete len:364 (-) Transcript_14057:82-1173(-)
MKCVQVSAFTPSYDFEQVISIRNDAPRPVRKIGKDQLLVRVVAVSLAPGDCRVASGQCELFQAPKEGFPYIPGGDCSGIVVEADPDSRFKPGDAVISTFDSPRPVHCLAEYAVVNASRAETFNAEKISFADAACLPSSALAALNLVPYLKRDDRVMILGGGGGVGPFLLQLCKLAGISYLACTSTRKDGVLEELGADRVIDYTSENWWQLAEFKESPFDVVFDLAGGPNGWPAIRQSGAVKTSPNNGRYITLTMETALLEVHNYLDLVCLMWKFFRGSIYNRIHKKSIPSYRMLEALKLDKSGSFRTLLDHVEAGRLKVTQHRTSPFDFTESGVQAAFKLQSTRHAHGKVVVQVTDSLIVSTD